MHVLYAWVFIILPVRSQFLTQQRDFITGTLGGSLTVQCHYERGYEDYTKYWCRGGTRSCTIVAKTTSVHKMRWDRGYIRDDRHSCTIIVTMDRLTEGDNGRYQCGIKRWFWDSLFLVKVTVIPAPTTLKSTTPATITSTSADNDSQMEESTQSTSAIILKSITEPSATESSAEHIIVLYLMPALGVLLIMFLLTAMLFIQAWKKRKQALNRGTSQRNDNIQLSNAIPDTSPIYAVVKKPRKNGIQNNTIPTVNTVMPGDCYEEIQDSPQNLDTIPIYAVVKKQKKTGIQDTITPTPNAGSPDDSYEEMQGSPSLLDKIPIYAVVKKPGKTGIQDNIIPTPNTGSPDDSYEGMQDSPWECPQTEDASYSTIQFAVPDPQKEIYTNIALPQRDSSQDCLYSVVKA